MTMQFMQIPHRTFRLATIAIAFSVMGSAAQGQQQPSAAALATAKEIVSVTGSSTLFNPLISGVIEQSKLLLLQQNPTLAKPLNEIADKLRTELAPRFDELVNELARQYATRFTEQELKDLLAFDKSPLGRKLQTEQPAIVDATMQFAQTWGNAMSDQVITKMREELKKRGFVL
jgi:uncharacterized protein